MKLQVLLSSFLLATFSLPNHSDSSPKEEAARYALREASKPIGTIQIIIDKSDYELHVYDDKGWYASYPVVFGNNSLGDKKMEGDKNTPEGTFSISHKKPHNKWSRFLGIDYPTKDSWEKFNLRKKRGEIPSSARIGGAIGIHGTWPKDDFVVDKFKNWTEGCISMKNVHVEELYTYTPVGTKIVIRK